MKKTLLFLAVFTLAFGVTVAQNGGLGLTPNGQEAVPTIDPSGQKNVAGTGLWMFPHVFHLDENNTTSITVTNNSDSVTVEVQVSFRARDGEKSGEKQVFDLAPHSSRRVELAMLDEGFVGTSTVYCVGFSCLPVATWEFNFGADRRFAVGVPGVSSLTNDNHWAALTTNPDGNFALAIMNFLAQDNPCTLDHYNLEGEMVASEEFVLPRFAQRAEFAEVPEGFTGRSELRCIGNVAVTSVVQDPVNGFPTAGFPMKQTFPPR